MTSSCCLLQYDCMYSVVLLVVSLLQDTAAAAWVAGPAAALLAVAAGDTRLLRFRGSDVAAAALALGRNAAGAVPPWPLCLASLTGHAVSPGYRADYSLKFRISWSPLPKEDSKSQCCVVPCPAA
jgi:hypothetical protein